jgi:hypothetical protein
MLYTFTLDSIACHKKRCQDEYLDALFVHWQASTSSIPRVFIAQPLGLQGPRYTALFGPGTVVSLEPRVTWGPGFDKPWTLEIDLEEDQTVALNLAVQNQRFVSDPYKAAKVAAATATAKEAASALTLMAKGAVGGVAGEGAKKLLDLLLGDDWPQCAGDVLVADWHVRPDELGLGGGREFASAPLGMVPEGCGQPDYTATMTWKRVSKPSPPPRFGRQAKTTSRRYVAMNNPAPADWFGAWRESSDPESGATVFIEGVPGSPNAYTVRVSEHLEDGTPHIRDAAMGPLTPQTRRDLFYDGETTPGRARLDSPAIHQVDSATPLLGAEAAPLLATQSTQATQLRGLPPELLLDIWKNIEPDSPSKPIDELTAHQVREHFDAIFARDLTEPGATLIAPERGIVLRLYTATSTLSDGATITETVLRYTRADSFATPSDYRLGRHSVIR